MTSHEAGRVLIERGGLIRLADLLSMADEMCDTGDTATLGVLNYRAGRVAEDNDADPDLLRAAQVWSDTSPAQREVVVASILIEHAQATGVAA